MKILITIDRTKALLAGRDQYGPTVVEIPAADIPEDLRPILTTMRVADTGAYVLQAISGGTSGTYFHQVQDPAEATPETVIQWLRDYQAARSAWQAAKDAELAERVARTVAVMAEWSARPVGDQVSHGWHSGRGSSGGNYSWQPEIKDLPYPMPSDIQLPAEIISIYQAARLEAQAECDRRNADDASQAAAAKASREAETQAAADRKQSQLADAVARFGDDSQRARWTEGVLPTREAVDLIVAEALAPVRAAGIEVLGDVAPEIEHADECHEGDDTPEIDTDETVLPKLSAKTYAALIDVRKAVPQGSTVEAIKTTATCKQCETKASRTYIRASWMVGEIEVEIAVPA